MIWYISLKCFKISPLEVNDSVRKEHCLFFLCVLPSTMALPEVLSLPEGKASTWLFRWLLKLILLLKFFLKWELKLYVVAFLYKFGAILSADCDRPKQRRGRLLPEGSEGTSECVRDIDFIILTYGRSLCLIAKCNSSGDN